GDVATAYHLLVGAIGSDQEASDAVLVEALRVLILLCFFGGRAEMWRPFYSALADLQPNVPGDLTLISKTFADPARNAAEAVPQLEEAIAGLTDEADPAVTISVGFACSFADRLSECRHALRRVADAGRDGGGVGLTIQALVLLGWEAFWSGQWDKVLRLCD